MCIANAQSPDAIHMFVQKRLGKETIRMHLPPALGGALDGDCLPLPGDGDTPIVELGAAALGVAADAADVDAAEAAGDAVGKRSADDAEADDNGRLGKGGRRGAKARRVLDVAKT